jgi:hypothetical protein
MLRQDSGWSNPKVLAIFTMIFLCGMAFGAVAMREVLHAKVFGPAQGMDPMEGVKRVGLESLKVELNLTPAQVKTVEEQLDQYAKYYQNIEEQRADIEEQRKNVAEIGRQKILGVLTDAQRKRFNELFRKTSRK